MRDSGTRRVAQYSCASYSMLRPPLTSPLVCCGGSRYLRSSFRKLETGYERETSALLRERRGLLSFISPAYAQF